MTTFSAHNPTVLADVGLVSWYGGGVRAVDLSDPASPAPAGAFVPEPIDGVLTEDPAATYGRYKVETWSYPVVVDGLVYVVDVRNGLYVLDYDGPNDRTVATTDFFEGNSNRGDARG